MCGICGFTGEVLDRDKTIRRMTEVITHRGPDSDGFFMDKYISMGFRRLSIIDLEEGHQPIYNEDKTLVLTFNGEIYNYKELRKELEEAGHKFYTKADSEVLVHGYEEWQEDMLLKLRGMFGFAIYNTKDQSIFIARDFFGIKPMHYAVVGENRDFIYASEIKSILEHPKYEKKFNYKALDTYLSFQYAVPPETFFEGIYCLLPGHYMTFKNGEVETVRYFEARFKPDENMTEEEAVDKIEKVFEDSVNAHKIADVEVGCFLSSGVDSSYVSTYFADQKTFTVGFDFGEKYNEISWAKNLSKEIGVEHHTHLISSEEFWDAVPTVQYHMDQPLADPSCIALYFVSRLASDYVKVVLSGEGADELFGGYTCYNDPRVFKIYQKIIPYALRRLLCRIAKKLPDIRGRDYIIRATHPLEKRYIGNAFMYDYDQKRELLRDPSIATKPQRLTRRVFNRTRRQDDVTRMQTLDINLWMVGDILLKADRMSMANSLELRVPFLDKEVFKVASTLPTNLRVNKHNTKYAMRKAAQRHLPIETAEKEKLGFPVPTRVWLRDEQYYKVVKEAFTSETAQKFFNTDILLNWLDVHFSGKEDNSRKIWTIYIFIVWYNIYFKDERKVEKPQNHLVELKAKAEAQRKLQKQKAAIEKVQAELASQEGLGDDGYAQDSTDNVEEAFDDDDQLASRFQNLQENIVGSIQNDTLTPLQQAEQAAMEYEIVSDDDHVIEEDEDYAEEEPAEEYIDITQQSEITDESGIIRDDVIDSILNDVDALTE
ncbi:MAG: asparagine synthase (glutamine-hydrolyzing) [Ruminococcus sp.]|nr:asparagine synthase (glutamine-hydrolyzing) [Ruminococcus sp.]